MKRGGRLKTYKPLKGGGLKGGGKPLKRNAPFGKVRAEDGTFKNKPRSEKQRQRDREDQETREACREDATCCAFGWDGGPKFPRECWGGIETAHVFGRDDAVIRQHPLNVLPLCHGHHQAMTASTRRWHRFIEEKFPGRLAELRVLRRGGKTCGF